MIIWSLSISSEEHYKTAYLLMGNVPSIHLTPYLYRAYSSYQKQLPLSYSAKSTLEILRRVLKNDAGIIGDMEDVYWKAEINFIGDNPGLECRPVSFGSVFYI